MKTATLESCPNFTNEKVLKIIENSKLGLINEFAQKYLDEIRKLVITHFEQQSTSCKVQFIELPALFQGELRDMQNLVAASTLFPDVVNLVSASSKVYVPDAQLELIRERTRVQIQGIGTDVGFVDTFFDNLAGGNLHCTTKVLRYCRMAH